MTAEEEIVREWDPSDYILHGRHCPKTAIQETLKIVMQALGAKQIIHIAFANQRIVRTLSFALGYPDQLNDKLNRLLEKDASDIHNASIAAAVHGYGNGDILGLDAVRFIANDIVNITGSGYSLASAEAKLFIGQLHSGLYLTHTGSTQATPEIGDIRSIILMDAATKSARSLHASNLARQLAVQLKSTAEASTLTDMAIMKRVAERLSIEGHGASASSFPDIAAKALDLALDVASGAAGAIYFVSAKASHPLELLVTTEPNAFPVQIPSNDVDGLGLAISTNLAIQRTDWRLASSETRTAAPPGGLFLLMPIGGPIADTERPAIGVLVLRRDDQSNTFNAYDLAQIRNVALRISLARTTDAMARIGSSTSALQAPTDWLAIQEDLQKGMLNQSAFHALGSIPTDVRMAARRIAPALAELATLTDSHSVVLRIVLPSMEAKQSHGLALVKVACHPEELLTSLEVQTEDMGGFNWMCIREGKLVYSSDISGNFKYLQTRAETVCELAVPIWEEGRLVGVLSLESSLYDLYGQVLPLIISFAGAVGRTLADARAALEVNVVDSAAQVLNHRHTMASQLDTLDQHIQTISLDHENTESLISGLAGIQSELAGIRSELTPRHDVVSPEAAETVTIPQILVRAANMVDYLGALPDGMWEEQFMRPIKGTAARALEVVITNILRNLMNYTAASLEDTGNKPLRAISLSTANLENQSQIVLSFQNYANGSVDPERIADLYRCPVSDYSGKLRLGGFLAGINARRANARLQATVLSDGRTVHTTLIVPVGD